MALLENTLSLYLDAAPWLLAGLLAAGLIRAWIPEGVVGRWLGGRGPWPVVKAALIGAPLPLCSCGVLPAALGLRRSGASRGPTLAFLIATPETGVDSVAVTYALMGPFMTVVRPVAAVASGVFTGLLAALLPERPQSPLAQGQPACGCAGSCGGPAATAPAAGRLGTTLEGLRYAMTEILDDVALWLAVGLLLAGALATWIPPGYLAQWGGGPLAMGVMLLIGIPMYICATASTPVAAALLLAGVSPGTVLVFLLAGPATNIATLAVVRRELGGATLGVYLAGIAVSSVAMGLLADALSGYLGLAVTAGLGDGAEVVPLWLSASSALLLALFAIRPVRRLILR